jgi:nitroimidazol reductase NimA-like FMN-containing flavoprotein (pyridoxamine 5'-phosphate oxidase superfamily)
MTITQPEADLDPRFSSPDADATPWEDARNALATAEVYWLSTVRSNGQPHVTPIAAIWMSESFYFCTGPGEQKAKNLARSPRCTVTTGCNSFTDGVDVVLEGEARFETDESLLQRLADHYREKYDGHFDFEVRNGAFYHEAGGAALVYRVEVSKGFAFAKGEPFGQTRWVFAE